MKPWLLTALFLAGFSLAWIIRRENPVAADTHPADTHTSSRPEKSLTTRPTADTLRTKAQLRDLLEKRTPQFAKDDYRKILQELCKLGGIDGLSDSQKSLMENLVNEWYAADPTAALNWVLELKDPDFTSTVLTSISGGLASKDLDAALAFAKQHGTDEGRYLKMPNQLRDMLGKSDAAQLLRIVGTFTSYRGYSSIMSKFSPDFDFRQALDGLAEMKKSLGKDEYISLTPSNILSEWAKRDWDAAWQWVLSGKEAPQNDITSLVTGVAKSVSPQEAADMAAYLAARPNQNPVVTARAVWDILSQNGTPEVIADYLAKAPGSRVENLAGLIAATYGRSGGCVDNERELLLTQMTPAERIAAFQSETVQNIQKSYGFDEYSAILRRLGHTDAEIKTMISQSPKE